MYFSYSFFWDKALYSSLSKNIDYYKIIIF